MRCLFFYVIFYSIRQALPAGHFIRTCQVALKRQTDQIINN